MAGTKNTLTDMYNIFAEQLERLNDTDLTADELDSEIKRAEAMSKISEPILKVADMQFKAWNTALEYGINRKSEHIPRLLEMSEE